MYIQKDSVCTGKKPTCFTHVDVLPVHMGGVSNVHKVVGFSACHTTHTPHHIRPLLPRPTHSNTPQHKMKQKMKEKMKEQMKEKVKEIRREKR